MTRRPDQISVSSPLGPPQSAPWLGLTGALMLLTAFALFNSWCGFAAERWPWALLSDGSVDLYFQAVLVAWLTGGLWALALGFTPARRVRAVGSAVLAGVLLAIPVHAGHPLAAVAHDPTVILNLLTAATLGAGLLLARDPSTHARGRLLAGIGGLLFVWMQALPSATGNASPLCRTWEEIAALFGNGAPTAAHVFGHTAPLSLAVLAALGALLAALGLTGRRLLLVWFFVLLGSALLATGTAAANASYEGLAGFADALTGAIVQYSLLLWLFVLFTIRDLGRWTRS